MGARISLTIAGRAARSLGRSASSGIDNTLVPVHCFHMLDFTTVVAAQTLGMPGACNT
jgi:hypothetical protein